MKLLAGWCKLNVDAAFNARTRSLGFSIIIRDSKGKVRVAKSMSKLGLVELVAAETMVVFYGVSYCCDQGFQSLIVEGDAKQVVDTIQLRGRDASNFGQLVDDVLVIVDSFSNWQIQYVNREVNSAAYVLAQVATKKVIDMVWIEVFKPSSSL